MKMPKNNVYTVSRLNGEVRQLLEGELGKIWLEAEISNFASPASGHWYLTLKDSHAQIRSAMFKGKNRTVTFRPSNGQQVLVKGAISVYEPRGDYQLIIESMLPAGDGLLAQQYEALKMKLAAEGLFAQETKRPLPKGITRIGVITSPTGAAIKDVLHVLERRDPSIEVIIYPAMVQGDGAEHALCHAIDIANQRQEVDVLLLTRGGGSLEDLWCFNSEMLAHCIYNSALPVVSAVGHEVDHTISDYVADQRAPTPSAGAELLSADAENKAQHLASKQLRLRQAWQHYLLRQSQRSAQLDHRLARQDPKRRLQQLEQTFDEMQLRLCNALQSQLQQLTLRQQNLRLRLNNQSPAHQLNHANTQLTSLSSRLDQALGIKMKDLQRQLHTAAHQLEAVSPLATLTRGYSITQDSQGKVVQSSSDLAAGDVITTKLLQGEVSSKVL
ncbi:exodeoxyribonuclease VII large subunit [Shewanella waksmanii]|uniref:exodeoxyribonuclease VII large subunit n=1 Tax=Shewanella waksmanii TaxID=213783 RepID=UPI003736C7DF